MKLPEESKPSVRGLLTMAALVLVLSSCQDTSWYRGNMHTHSYWSDGDAYPEEVAQWYLENGYHFLVVTDHNRLQEGVKYRKTPDGDSVKLLTLEEYRSRFEKPGEFLLINGEEVTDAAERKPVHLNALRVDEVIPPAGGSTVNESLLTNVIRMREAMSVAGFDEWIVVNHPNFGWALTADDIAQSTARFFEVYNGHPSVHNYGDSIHPSTEQMWDVANLYRTENGLNLIYGVATDDAHHYHEFRIGRANPGRGWCMIQASDLSETALYEAMLAGDFYASTGVEIDQLKITSGSYRVNVKHEEGVGYTIEFIGIIAGKETPELLLSHEGTAGVYRFTGNERFVRARILSNKMKENPFAEGDVEMAWCQPYSPGR